MSFRIKMVNLNWFTYIDDLEYGLPVQYLAYSEVPLISSNLFLSYIFVFVIKNY